MNREIELAIQKEAVAIVARKASKVARERAKQISKKMIKEFVMTKKFEILLKRSVQKGVCEGLRENYWSDLVSEKFYRRFTERLISKAFL